MHEHTSNDDMHICAHMMPSFHTSYADIPVPLALADIGYADLCDNLPARIARCQQDQLVSGWYVHVHA